MSFSKPLEISILAALALAAAAMAGNGVWTTTYPPGGSIPAGGLVLDPANPAVLYTAPTWRGLYQTTDGAASWASLTDDQYPPFSRSGIEYLVFDSATDALYLIVHNVIMRTTDEGATWSQVDSGIVGDVDVVAVDPLNPSVLYAGTSGNGLFKSTDGGASWSATGGATLPADRIISLTIDPATPQIVYLGTWASGIHKSTDGGATWVFSNNNVTMTTVLSILVDSANPSIVYAADGDWSTGMGIFKSIDGGASWTKLPPHLPFLGQFGSVMAFDPTNTSILYVATYGEIYKSTDGGTSWASYATGADQMSSVVVDPGSPSTVFAGSSGRGVFKSTDGGLTWGLASSAMHALVFTHSRAHGLAFDASDPAVVYAGSIPNGWRSVDGGVSWASMSPDGLASTYDTHVAAPGVVYAFQCGFRKSTDYGLTWSDPSGSLFDCTADGDLAVHSGDPQTVYLGSYGGPAGDGIWKSTDGGTTWAQVNNGVSNTQIRILAVDPADGAVVYAGTQETGGGSSALFKTTDGGANWYQLFGGLPGDFYTNQIVVHPADSNRVLMGAEGSNGGVYLSTDGGNNWQQILSENVNSVAFDPDNGNRIYVGTWSSGGFYRTLDGGNTWTQINSGLPLQPGIEAVVVDPADSSRILIGTTGGVWEQTFAGSVTYTVTHGGDGGPGSLRDAIEQANSDGLPTVIEFDPSMAGQSIWLDSPLPEITEDQTTIDGDFGGDCVPDVELRGDNMGGYEYGLTLRSSNNLIRGLLVNRFPGDGIHIGGPSGNALECNHVGVDWSATWNEGNGGAGVWIESASDNTVGPGNVIAFNANGVVVADGLLDGYPDFTGLTPDAIEIFPLIDFSDECSAFHSADGITPVDGGGIPFYDTFGLRLTGLLTVGTAGDYTFELIDFVDQARLHLDGSVVLDADCCGTTSTTQYLGLGDHDVQLDYLNKWGAARLKLVISGPGSATLTTGGSPGLEGELFRLRDPVEGNRITQNSVFDNNGLGIDLNATWCVIPNDPGDIDVGGNTFLDHPEWIFATDLGGGSFSVDGTATPDSTVEIFAVAADPWGHGEGKEYLGSVTADPVGDFSTTVSLPPGYFLVTATATDALGNTSEFAANFKLRDNAVTVDSTADSGEGTLRDALDEANRDGVPTEIGFDPAMAGQTILLINELPGLDEGGTTIDADLGGDCLPDVAIDGSLVNSNGLVISSSYNVVRGLAIHGFTADPSNDGIQISNEARFNLVECNYIGLSGGAALGNAGTGVILEDGSGDNQIGPGNVIAINALGGVVVWEGSLDAYPEFAGLTPDASGVFPVIDFSDESGAFTSSDGITPLDGSGNTFTEQFGARFTGTLSIGAGGGYDFTLVGLDDWGRVLVDGAVILDEQCCGSYSTNYYLDAGDHDLRVDFMEGGGAARLTLQISGPGSVSLSTGGQPGLFGELFQLRIPIERVTITGNSIFHNGSLGIDLGWNGVSANDPGDLDAGPNTVLNYPELTGFTDHGGGSFTVDGTAPPDSTVEVFGAAPDRSGHGQGKEYLGTATADPSGDFSLGVTLPAEFFAVTATATDAAGNTSEFAPNLSIKTPDAVTVGTAEILQGETGEVPLYVRDLSATLLGLDQPAGNRIQAFALQVRFSRPGSVAAITAERAGIAAGLTSLWDTYTVSGDTITWIASFNESTNLVPFTLDGAAPGDQVAKLTVTLDPAAPPTPFELTLVGSGTSLHNQAGTLSESEDAGTLELFHGSITVRTRAATALWAAGASASEIQLTWSDPQVDEIGFRLERSPDGSSWVVVDTLGPDQTSYLDSGLDPATLYYYRVISFAGGGDNPASNTAAAETFPAAAARTCVTQASENHTFARLPDVAWNGTSWATLFQERSQSTNDELFFQFLNGDGSPAGGWLPITRTDMMSQIPNLKWNGSRYGLIWGEHMRGPNGEITSNTFFGLLDANGQRLRSGVRLFDSVDIFFLNNNLEWALEWDGGGWGFFAGGVFSEPWSDVGFWRFSEGGEVLVGPVQVTSTPDQEYDVSTAWSGSEYGVAWIRETGPDFEVLFQRLQTDGTPPPGDPGPIQVWQSQPGQQAWYTSLVWNGSGWAVAWTVGDPSADDWGVHLRLLAPDGTPAGPAKRLSDDFDSEFPPEEQWPVYDEIPELHAKPGGGYVCFTSSATGASGWAYEIGRLEADAAGNKVGRRTLLSDVDNLHSIWNRSASDGTNFLVSYSDHRQGTQEAADVLVDADGQVIGGPHDLTCCHSPGNSTFTAGAWNPVVAPFQGGFVTVWNDWLHGSVQIHGQVFDAAGAPAGQFSPLSGREVKGLAGLAAVGDTFAVAWKDGGNAIVFERFTNGNPQVGEAEIATDTGGRHHVDLAFSGEVYGVAYYDGQQVTLLQVDPWGGVVAGPTAISGDRGGPIQVQWTGAGWALVWRGASDNNLRYALVDAWGAVLVADTAITSSSAIGNQYHSVWSGARLGVAWAEDRGVDPPSREIYFTELDLDGTLAYPEILVLNPYWSSGPPRLYWRGDRFGLVRGGGDGSAALGTDLHEDEILPGGTLLANVRQLSNRGNNAAVAFNGATLGMVWGQVRELFFQTDACLADASPPACPDLTIGFDDQAVNLAWTPVSDPESTLYRYNLYRDGFHLAELFPQTESFDDEGFRPNTVHGYEVRGLNGAYLESAGCPVVNWSTRIGDANGDGDVTSADIFYLINHFFAGGPPPVGDADANGDGQVTVADIFYLINYLFGGGAPPTLPWERPAEVETGGEPRAPSLLRVGRRQAAPGSRVSVPVFLRQPAGETLPEAVALRVGFDPTAVTSATLRRGRGLAHLETIFEVAPATPDSAAYLVSFEQVPDRPLAASEFVLAAMLDLTLASDLAPGRVVELRLDADVTLLGNREGTEVKTLANGGLRLKEGGVEVLTLKPEAGKRPAKRRLAREGWSRR